MNDNNFEEIFAWGKERGLKLHTSVSRLCVDGVYGMYATKDIPKFTVIAQYPKKNLLPLLDNVKYPEETPYIIKYAHAAVKEFSDPDSSWACFREGLYSDTFFKNTNVYYFTEDEVNFLETVNRTLSDYIRAYRRETETQINSLCSFDKGLDREFIEKILFNVRYRSWHDFGFVPVLDIFNHSNLNGIQLHDDKDRVFLVATVDYKEGDQIWINYGQKDLYLHAIDYGYFDPDGNHFIDLGLRLSQAANNDFQRKIFDYVATKYPILHDNSNDGLIRYKLSKGVAFLLDHAPNMRAIDFVRDISYGTEQELLYKQCPLPRFKNRILQYINVLSAANNIDDFSIEGFPEKLRYFYHMLEKEKSMLNRNKEWVLMANGEPGIIPPQLFIEEN